MAEPAIYRNSRRGANGRHDVFVHVVLPPGREHRFSHRVIGKESRDQKGRILLELLDHQPGSHAPWQMWVDPGGPGCGIVKEIAT